VPLLECCRAWACLRVSSLGEPGQSLHASLVADGQWLIARGGPGHSWLISAPNMVHDCVVNVLMSPACGAGDTGSSEQRLEPQHVLTGVDKCHNTQRVVAAFLHHLGPVISDYNHCLYIP